MLGFLVSTQSTRASDRPELFHKLDLQNNAWASPRTWEMASQRRNCCLDLLPLGVVFSLAWSRLVFRLISVYNGLFTHILT